VDGYETDPEVLAVPLLFKPFSIGDLSAAVTRALTTTQARRISIGPRIPLNKWPSHGASGDSGSRNADGLLTS
jgi:hypothetical protein